MSEGSSPQTPQDDYYVMFYNVENFFDTFDDPDKDDDEFTPNGARRWTSGRFKNKIVNLSKVVLNISGWNPPAIIALCEAENRYVLEKLLDNSPLKVFNYDIIHKNSPDTRGIDVATKEQIYAIVRDLAAKGKSVLYLSGDPAEVLIVADRIMVMQKGRIKRVFDTVPTEDLLLKEMIEVSNE